MKPSMSPLNVAVTAYDHRSGEEQRFDVLSEALAWGRKRAAALATAGGLGGAVEEACEDGVLIMGQVTDAAGLAVDAEALVWVGLEAAEAQGNAAHRG